VSTGTAMAARMPTPTFAAIVRGAWESLSVYLPIILMGVLALGTYWLARNTPVLGAAEAQRPASHDPDYSMQRFSVKTFDATGKLKTEIHGTQGRHYPDTDTLEIDQPQIRSFNPRGELTVATARLAISNSDGSEVQLVGDAVVTREAVTGADGRAIPRMELRSEFLDAFLNTERVKSHKPVELLRGGDRFTADSLDYDNLDRIMQMHGRVHGVLPARPAP
jgi:lipopolysaccharide export system protein LptC